MATKKAPAKAPEQEAEASPEADAPALSAPAEPAPEKADKAELLAHVRELKDLGKPEDVKKLLQLVVALAEAK